MKIIKSNIWIKVKERQALVMLLSSKLEDVKYIRAKINKIDKELE